MAAAQPIIIKRKVSHGGHHGGAWKVAYADFVTAMMALFIVLWLMNTSKQIQQAVGGYFKDPKGSSKKVGSNQMGSGENLSITRDDMKELKDVLQNNIRRITDFNKLKDQIEMTVTAEGLRIELLESATGTFFDSGNSQPTESGRDLLTMLAHELGSLPNKISIEGHTDSKPYGNVTGTYTNWELSADRANAARRIMQENGIRADQVSQVRGFADQRLRKPDQPEDPSNRRISLIVQYVVKDDDSPKAPAGEPGAQSKEGAAAENKGGPAPPAKDEPAPKAKPEGAGSKEEHAAK